MLSETHDRLAKARERVRAARKTEAMLKEAEQSLRDELDRYSALKERLEAEQADVARLEGYGLTALFYSVLGTHSDHLEKEKQEYLAAKLKYDESHTAVGAARDEVQRLREELARLADAEAEYDKAVRAKEELLVRSADGRAQELAALSERLADLQADEKELREAIDAGESALASLREVESELTSAENWGTWDLLGGGLLATMAKHSRIDAARDHAHTAQQRLRKFREELADAGGRLNVSLEMDGFAKFADYFFDGLIADWVMQSKIHAASSACGDAVAAVTAALAECRRRLADAEVERESVGRSRLGLIEGG